MNYQPRELEEVYVNPLFSPCFQESTVWNEVASCGSFIGRSDTEFRGNIQVYLLSTGVKGRWNPRKSQVWLTECLKWFP